MTEERAIVALNMQETMMLGKTLAESGYFSDARGAAQAVVKVLAGRELDFGPIASMTGIHIVQGKPTLGANLMGAAIKRSGRYDYRVKELNDDSCSIIFFDSGQQVGESTFTMQDAKKAGLSGKDNWRKYPRNMLFSRAISNGARWYCPDVFAGVTPYTPDELGAEVDGDTGDVIDAEVIQAKNQIEEPTRPTPPRPYSAETVRLGLHKRAGGPDSHGPGATDKQAIFLARKFQEAFATTDAEKRYHLAIDYLWDVDSAKGLTIAQASATLNWLLGDNKPDSTGDTPLSEFASAEAGNVYRAALKAQGQTEMPLSGASTAAEEPGGAEQAMEELFD